MSNQSWYDADCPCLADDCNAKGAQERYSLGVYAGKYCDRCWRESGFRKEGASGFDPADAGESYDEEPATFEPDDGIPW